MNETTKLRFRAWRKPEVVFTLLDWRPQSGMANLVDTKGDRQVMYLVLPGSQVQRPPGLWPTFPSAIPTEIEDIALLPPPCRTTRQEAEVLRAKAAEARNRPAGAVTGGESLPDWELVQLRHDDTILLPRKEDDTRFEKRLAAFKAKKQHEYEARKAELEQCRTMTFGQMVYLGGGRFYKWIDTRDGRSLVERWVNISDDDTRFLRRFRKSKPPDVAEAVESALGLLECTFTRPLSDSLGRPHGGYLNWTLEVARHEPVIRDRVLQRRWAIETDHNLAEMRIERAAFLQWYRAMWPHPPARSWSVTRSIKELSLGVSPWLADMVLCAEVRFRVRFADGSRIWLADCPLRQPLLTVAEQWLGNSPSAKPLDAPAPTAPAQNLKAAGKRIDDVAAIAAATLTAAGENLTKAGQQTRADVEAGAATLGARTQDLAKTLGKVSEAFADPLVATAKDAPSNETYPACLLGGSSRNATPASFPR